MAQAVERAEPVDLCHFGVARIERSRSLAHGHYDIRDLVDGNSANGRSLVQAEPDIGEHDNDQCGNVEEENEPRVEKLISAAIAAKEDADDRADDHGDEEGSDNAPKRHPKMIGQIN